MTAEVSSEVLFKFYEEATERVRQLDSLAYQLLQFYVTLYAATFAAQNLDVFKGDTVWIALAVVSVLFLLVMARVRRNYWLHTTAAQSIEGYFEKELSFAPYTYVLSNLRRIDRSLLGAIPASYLYYVFFVLGAALAIFIACSN